MSGDVGAVAELLNLLASWFLKPEGYQTLTRENKLKALLEALKVALDAKAFGAADLIFQELRKLSQEVGP